MTAPSKPWEAAGLNSRLANPSMDTTILSSSAPPVSQFGSTSAVNRMPSGIPALPPRPYATQRPGFGGLGMGGLGSGMGMTGGYGSYGGGYGSSFGSYGSGLGGIGGYGNSYSGYGGGFGGGYGQSFGSPYGAGYGGGMFANVESRFIQLAEESSRPAFQSIESLVGAVGSVAMMLESTFVAITSSFRAILGVADNFGRLRTLFAQFWSTFALIRGINWLLKKLLVLMGIRSEDEFRAWAGATAAQGSGPGSADVAGAPRGSSWAVLMFLGVITAAPYLILKLLGSITSTIQANASDPSTWQNPHRALAQYEFQASSPQEISFHANQVVTIAPEAIQGNLWNSGWLIATVDQKTSGLIPANYVKLFRTAPTSTPNTNASLLTNTSISTDASIPTTVLPMASGKSSTEALTTTAQIAKTEDAVKECSTGDALQKLVLNAQPVVDFEKTFEDSKSSE